MLAIPSPLSLVPRRAPASVVDRARSRRLANLVESRAGQTHRDALRALMFEDDAVYVEGVVVTADRDVTLLEHAWLEVSGVVLDPAPQFQGGPIPTYFRAFAWTGDEIGSLCAAHRGLTPPFATCCPDRGRGELAWREAALAAAQHRSALRLARTGVSALGPADPLGRITAR